MVEHRRSRAQATSRGAVRPRRTFLALATGMIGSGFGSLIAPTMCEASAQRDPSTLPPYGNGTLPAGIRSRFIANVNGMTVHALEAGYESPGRRAVLLLHGFPELAYSWRKVMLPLAEAGYHVIAPDQRGYGRTTGWDGTYEADPDPFRMLNMVRDAMGLVLALGHRTVSMLVGHDAGAPVAAWAALVRPDIFRSVVIMSSPFAGPPDLAFNIANGAPMPPMASTDDDLDRELAKLSPPRKYYQNHQRTRGANNDMLHAPQGLHAFLRAYYHYKSADWKGNNPHPLKARTAEEMAKVPTYYVMEKNKSMAATVAPFMPPPSEVAACRWLTDTELGVYVSEYSRTEFTGALQGYRVRRGSDPKSIAEMLTFAGRTIDVPAMFVGGKSDWGPFQTPGALESMRSRACSRLVGVRFVDGAGHWVQQEQPEQVSRLLVEFVRAHGQA